MPKHVGDLMSKINCLHHPWALVGFFHRFMKNARYNDQVKYECWYVFTVLTETTLLLFFNRDVFLWMTSNPPALLFAVLFYRTMYFNPSFLFESVSLYRVIILSDKCRLSLSVGSFVVLMQQTRSIARRGQRQLYSYLYSECLRVNDF
jgi:hypothetical protein